MLTVVAQLSQEQPTIYTLKILEIDSMGKEIIVKQVVGKLDSNTFVIEKGATVIIIDAGASVEKVKTALNGKKPQGIFLTHEHYDHTWCLEDYKKEFDCKVYNQHSPQLDFKPKGANFEDLDLGDFKIQILYCPGHSKNSVVYKIDNLLFTGDVLFGNTIGRTDLMKDGDRLMQQTLKKLLDVKFDLAYHGHYESSIHQEQQKNIKRFIK